MTCNGTGWWLFTFDIWSTTAASPSNHETRQGIQRGLPTGIYFALHLSRSSKNRGTSTEGFTASVFNFAAVNPVSSQLPIYSALSPLDHGRCIHICCRLIHLISNLQWFPPASMSSMLPHALHLRRP
ncbi:hypothetical protein GALMADRAFT_459732 [Galerina marginata CBS 339.88]|uniref:Uncharacterized protein n=1 Tax=Galerina marginata (strain CBS 339.88) TaxID=685588 RepID=A0A067TAR1_GALM3|nr:hypothetical protein GALMADRAFT_459732 [Galerina marginata CBS 339.88]